MGFVRGAYGLCIVETTGVSDTDPRTIPSTPAWLWTRSNSPSAAARNAAWAFASWRYSAWVRPSAVVAPYRTGSGVTLRSRAWVRESPVANRVTSWPRVTSSSVIRPTTSSVPPYVRGGTRSNVGAS